VDAILGARGYVLDPDRPDFLVSSYVDAKERVQVSNHGYTYSRWGGWYAPQYTDVYEYTEGSLVLDVVDAKERTLIWRGTASKVVDPGWEPERRKLSTVLRQRSREITEPSRRLSMPAG
jgi:hypothetical protein